MKAPNEAGVPSESESVAGTDAFAVPSAAAIETGVSPTIETERLAPATEEVASPTREGLLSSWAKAFADGERMRRQIGVAHHHAIRPRPALGHFYRGEVAPLPPARVEKLMQQRRHPRKIQSPRKMYVAQIAPSPIATPVRHVRIRMRNTPAR